MAQHTTTLRISNAEFAARTDRLAAHLRDNKLSGVVLFERAYIQYYTGFAFIPTERPIAFALNAAGEGGMFVPRLELEHASANAMVTHVAHYVEYPHDPHPTAVLKTLLTQMGIGAHYAADSDGYPWVMGYRGPSLTQLLGHTPQPIAAFVEDQMAIKSEAELALIRESVKWGHLAHVLLQRYTAVGRSETEVSQRAGNEATRHMLDAIGPIYRADSPFSRGASAGYRGQIGRNAAIPHALANNIVFQAGDVLVTGANAPVWGYNSELERTMVIGPASDGQKRLFDHMVALQDLAFASMGPGIPCAEVDRKLRAYYEKHDLMGNWKHHVGHAIGLRYHEGPFLDIGASTVMQPGMVFTVEPGLYDRELGGYRHSDTVAITTDGIEIMTYYPRDLASLTLPV